MMNEDLREAIYTIIDACRTRGQCDGCFMAQYCDKHFYHSPVDWEDPYKMPDFEPEVIEDE